MIWTAHIDESGTHDSPIMLMGGYMGNEDQWKAFDAAWKALLSKERIISCHAKPLFHGEAQFRGWPRERREKFRLKVDKIVCETLQFGFTAIIRENDYKQLYKGQPNPRKLREDSQYGLLFRACLHTLESKITGGKVQPPDFRLDIILEAGHKNSGDVVRLFEVAKKDHLPGCEHMLGSLTLRDKSVYGLQAADLAVYFANRLERDDHQSQPSDIEISPHILKPGEPSPGGFIYYRMPVTQDSLRSLSADFLLPPDKWQNMQSK